MSDRRPDAGDASLIGCIALLASEFRGVTSGAGGRAARGFRDVPLPALAAAFPQTGPQQIRRQRLRNTASNGRKRLQPPQAESTDGGLPGETGLLFKSISDYASRVTIPTAVPHSVSARRVIDRFEAADNPADDRDGLSIVGGKLLLLATDGYSSQSVLSASAGTDGIGTPQVLLPARRSRGRRSGTSAAEVSLPAPGNGGDRIEWVSTATCHGRFSRDDDAAAARENPAARNDIGHVSFCRAAPGG